MTGTEIRKVRSRLGLTQRQLAEALDVCPNTVARWERGERQSPPYLAITLNALANNGRTPKTK